MRTHIQRVGPEDAAELLAHNPRNRPVSEKKVEELARTITGGDWRLTHQGIALLPGGDLLDGQHRLRAIVRAGRAVDLMVTVLDEDLFDVIDTGRPRNARDALHLAGVSWSNNLPAPIRLVSHYRGPLSAAPMRGSQVKLTNRAIVQLALGQPAYAELAPTAERLAISMGRRGLASGLLAALVVLHEDAPRLAEEQREFAERIAEPILLTSNHPILSLRRWLTVSVGQAPKDQGQLTMYGTLRAWNAYVEGRQLARILVRLGRDSAPKVSQGQPIAGTA
jgi:hypothetical protein